MILHLGKDYIVPVKDVIFILNYENANDNEDTMAYLKNLEAKVEKIYIAKSGIKSIVYARLMGKEYLYFSPISSVTLYKRANNL